MAGVNQDKPFRLHGAELPKPDSVEIVPPLNMIDLAFHEDVLRHAKGIVKKYEEWIKTRSK